MSAFWSRRSCWDDAPIAWSERCWLGVIYVLLTFVSLCTLLGLADLVRWAVGR